jgi:hypothetical protein
VGTKIVTLSNWCLLIIWSSMAEGFEPSVPRKRVFETAPFDRLSVGQLNNPKHLWRNAARTSVQIGHATVTTSGARSRHVPAFEVTCCAKIRTKYDGNAGRSERI